MKIDGSYTLVDGSALTRSDWWRRQVPILKPEVVRKFGRKGYYVVLPDRSLLGDPRIPKVFASYNAAKRVADTLRYVNTTIDGRKSTLVKV